VRAIGVFALIVTGLGARLGRNGEGHKGIDSGSGELHYGGWLVEIKSEGLDW
jgi:hypothetical protein